MEEGNAAIYTGRRHHRTQIAEERENRAGRSMWAVSAGSSCGGSEGQGEIEWGVSFPFHCCSGNPALACFSESKSFFIVLITHLITISRCSRMIDWYQQKGADVCIYLSIHTYYILLTTYYILYAWQADMSIMQPPMNVAIGYGHGMSG
jgi:hypothetical protein